MDPGHQNRAHLQAIAVKVQEQVRREDVQLLARQPSANWEEIYPKYFLNRFAQTMYLVRMPPRFISEDIMLIREYVPSLRSQSLPQGVEQSRYPSHDQGGHPPDPQNQWAWSLPQILGSNRRVDFWWARWFDSSVGGAWRKRSPWDTDG